MKRLLVLLLLAGLPATGAFAEITLNGWLRNDMAFTFLSNETAFNDVIENRLVLQRSTDNWKFYTDLRLKMYFGQAAEATGEIMNEVMTAMAFLFPAATNSAALSLGFGNVYVSVPRAFVKLYTPVGDVIVGKTYVSFGVPGIFNPFEFDKNVNFSDLAYDKEGILAVDYQYVLGSLAGGDIYVSPQYPLSNTAAGASFEFNAGSFDLGAAFNRREYNRNVAGLYFKGDVVVGVHGAYAYHFDDWFTNNFSEANAGLDYSFFEGKLIASADFYWADIGAESTNDYAAARAGDKYFIAKYYLYANAAYAPNEFISFKVDCFVNLIDGSGLAIPGLTWTVFDGLNLTVQAAYLWSSDNNNEFSAGEYGSVSTIFRLDAKL